MEPAALPSDDSVAYAVAHVLKLNGFFPEFKAEHLLKLFPHSGLFSYPDGAPVVTQGEEGRDIFILLEGSAAVRKEMGSAGAEVAALAAGDIIGEMGLLTDGVRSASVVATGPAKFFRLAAADLRYILANNHELSAHLKALASQRKG